MAPTDALQCSSQAHAVLADSDVLWPAFTDQGRRGRMLSRPQARFVACSCPANWQLRCVDGLAQYALYERCNSERLKTQQIHQIAGNALRNPKVSSVAAARALRERLVSWSTPSGEGKMRFSPPKPYQVRDNGVHVAPQCRPRALKTPRATSLKSLADCQPMHCRANDAMLGMPGRELGVHKCDEDVWSLRSEIGRRVTVPQYTVTQPLLLHWWSS
ncbi:hypothetical protein DR64_2409 [Paraburkholderia xenovorans LB400]|nr:hypothetical protein DR64_2409 [Paraburkholderia xenovorans LB400]